MTKKFKNLSTNKLFNETRNKRLKIDMVCAHIKKNYFAFLGFEAFFIGTGALF